MRDRDVNRDYPRVCRLSDHRKRLRDRAGEIAADPFQILYQKNYALCGNRLNLEFDLIRPSRPASARKPVTKDRWRPTPTRGRCR